MSRLGNPSLPLPLLVRRPHSARSAGDPAMFAFFQRKLLSARAQRRKEAALSLSRTVAAGGWVGHVSSQPPRLPSPSPALSSPPHTRAALACVSPAPAPRAFSLYHPEALRCSLRAVASVSQRLAAPPSSAGVFQRACQAEAAAVAEEHWLLYVQQRAQFLCAVGWHPRPCPPLDLPSHSNPKPLDPAGRRSAGAGARRGRARAATHAHYTGVSTPSTLSQRPLRLRSLPLTHHRRRHHHCTLHLSTDWTSKMTRTRTTASPRRAMPSPPAPTSPPWS